MVNRGNESSFELYATPSETTSSSDLIVALKDELNKIKRDGVTAEELKRVKTIVIADDVYQKDSVFNAAMQIGQLETQGYSHEILEDYIKNIKKVIPGYILESCELYFWNVESCMDMTNLRRN